MSDRLLPIVAGCRALIIYRGSAACNPYFAKYGREVTVINKSLIDEGCWIVDGLAISAIAKDYKLLPEHRTVQENFLMRIDGGDFKSERDSYELPREMAR